jgi:hypothetical protein
MSFQMVFKLASEHREKAVQHVALKRFPPALDNHFPITLAVSAGYRPRVQFGQCELNFRAQTCNSLNMNCSARE